MASRRQFRTRGGSVALFLSTYVRHTKGSRAGQRFLLEPWQQEFVDEFYSTNAKGKRVYRLGLLGIPRGNGKALALDTPVPTPSGWTTMGELQAGDDVFGPDESPTQVLATTLPMLGRECFDVEFAEAEAVVADGDHLWLTEQANQNNVPLLHRTREIAETLVSPTPRAGRIWSDPRHRVRLAAPRTATRRRPQTTQIIGCDRVASVPVRCITVDRPDGMFLAGRSAIPTHNSPLAAGLGLFELMSRRDSPDVFCAAGSRAQAGVVMDFARAFVDSGDLRDRVTPSRRSLKHDASNGIMRVISSEGSLQYGLSVSAAIVDELHAITTEAQEETWNALFSALHKRQDSFALGISQAGYNKRTLLGRLYDETLALTNGEDRFDGCLRIRRDPANGVLAYWYGIPETRENEWEDEKLWRIVNPASWLGMDTLRKQLAAPGFDELDFKRLHLSMWTKTRDSWLAANVWNGLAVEKAVFAAAIPAGADVYLGVDIGYYHDSSAVVLAHRVKGGELDGSVALQAKVWTTKEEDVGEFVSGGKMRLSLVRDHIDALAKRYKVRKIGFDPKYFMPIAEEFDRRGLQTVEYLPSSNPMNEAYKGFYRSAMEGTLVHDGDPILSAHVEATAADKTENGWRIRKLRATNRIDATVAAAIAHSLCEIHGQRAGPPKIYWMGQ